ncbi:MAG TPA: hypothetical protein VGF24_35315 [Vicinamibacterales bacterium]|jgi:hypothetical protein
MSKLFGVVLIAIVTCLLGTPNRAGAQEQAAHDFARLQERLKTNDSVIVTTQDGSRIKGRLVSVSPERIALRTDGTTRDLPADRVSRVKVRRNGVVLGALIGLGVGIPFGIALREYAVNEGGSQAGAMAFPMAVGLGAGIGIDALVAVPRTVFERKSPPQAAFSFVVAPQQAGVRVTMVF